MSIKNRLSRGVKATLGANLLDIVSNGLLIVVLSRYLLSPDEYGLLYFALSVLGMVSIFGTIGLPSSLSRYVTEYDEKNPAQVPHILRSSLLALLALSTTVGVVVSLGSPWIASWLDEPRLTGLLSLGIVYLVARALNKYLTSAFQGLNHVSYSALANSVSSVVRFVGTVGLVMLGFGVAGAFAGYLAGYLAAVVVGFAILYWKFYRPYDHAAEREDGLFRRILEYSIPLTATRGASVLDKRVDTILIGVLLSPTAVAFYTVPKQVASFAVAPANSLGFTISPTVGEQKTGGRDRRAARLYEQSLEHILLLYVPAVVGLFVVAGPLVEYVFGTAYLGAVPVLQVMSLYVLVSAIDSITSDGLDFLGRARDRAVVKSTMAVSNFLLNLLLIPLVGVVGAAIATVLTYSAYTLSNVYIISQELPIEFAGTVRTVSSVSAISAVMGGSVFFLRPYISGIPSLFVVVGLGVGLWGLLATAGGLLDVRRIAGFLT